MLVSNTTAVPAIINSLSGFVTSSTLSFIGLNLLLMMFLMGPFIMVLLLFKDNKYILYGTMIMEGILWAVAVYAIIQKIHQYPSLIEKVLSNITQIAVKASAGGG
ncbi:hypothetical protein IPA_03795 [Ignicoccus pacificus DSM 13166]|uniref:Uncharacterized protein n=1 Tax=Ignicoccus pacificus DSM 13166 TaxID=940294 RepID=A0A977PKT3_9CREN|nr:hypothetical protein IPA_03795 [Ignicoccus pacificus DSM 13166]